MLESSVDNAIHQGRKISGPPIEIGSLKSDSVKDPDRVGLAIPEVSGPDVASIAEISCRLPYTFRRCFADANTLRSVVKHFRDHDRRNASLRSYLSKRYSHVDLWGTGVSQCVFPPAATTGGLFFSLTLFVSIYLVNPESNDLPLYCSNERYDMMNISIYPRHFLENCELFLR